MSRMPRLNVASWRVSFGALAAVWCTVVGCGPSSTRAEPATGPASPTRSSPPAAPESRAPTSGDEVPIVSSVPEAVALYRTALDLADNFHLAEASAAAAEALALDPKFAQAKALASTMTPGTAGFAMAEQAVAEAAALPEPA